jgi:two-component system sensor histidine kinase MprB
VRFRRRITSISAAAVAVAIVLGSVTTYLLVSSELHSNVDSQLRGEVSAFTRSLRATVVLAGPGAPLSNASFQRLGARLKQEHVRIVDAHGKPLTDAQIRALLQLPARQRPPAGEPDVFKHLPGTKAGQVTDYRQLVSGSGTVVPAAANANVTLPVTSAVLGLARRASTRPVLFDAQVGGTHVRMLAQSAGRGYAIEVARPLTDTDHTLSRLRLILAIIDVGGIALAALLGRLVAGAVLTPVKRLTGAAEHVTATRDLSQRITPSGQDELGRLAVSFNAMLDALDRSIRALDESVHAQRQLVADASHELRTPVTSLRANLEMLQAVPTMDPAERGEMLSAAVEQAEELTLLMNDLIELARGDQPAAAYEELRLDQLVEDVIDRYRLHAPGTNFDVELEPTLIEGVPARLARAVGNLIDNAVKWSPDGGPVDVALSDGELRVRDHGPGIADADRPHVFDRFYRGAEARGRPGSGLGLAIVRQVVEAHEGSITAEAAPGGGTVMRMRMPILTLTEAERAETVAPA